MPTYAYYHLRWSEDTAINNQIDAAYIRQLRELNCATDKIDNKQRNSSRFYQSTAPAASRQYNNQGSLVTHKQYAAQRVYLAAEVNCSCLDKPE